jgi:ABC-2 type transport system ATP-binding protein
VEQICSHAAVVDRGRLVAAGTVAELTGSGRALYLEVDDTGRAASLLSSMPGVKRVSPEGRGLSVEFGGIERKDIVRALVVAGVGVETAMSRHALEDAFISMLEGEPA